MKFEINSINFSKLITQINKIKNKNNLNPNFNNVYFELNENLLTVRVINLEINYENTIPVKGLINGKCLLNREIILKISNSFSNLDINIVCELINGLFNITFQKNKINLKTQPNEDFPNLPKPGKFITNINLKKFINLIKLTSFCAASTEIKPEISSVYLYSKNNELYSVATDSFRLSEKKTNFKIDEENDLNILISKQSINEIINLLENSILDNNNKNLNNHELNIYKNENTLTFESQNTIITTRSINGNFPDYKQLFPKTWTTKIKLQKEDLKNTLNLSTVFVNNYSYVDLDLDIENKILKIKSKNDLIGSLEKEIILSEATGENIQVSYNSGYFLESLSHLDGPQIEIMFTTTNRPMFFRSVLDNSLTCLLMPLNR